MGQGQTSTRISELIFIGFFDYMERFRIIVTRTLYPPTKGIRLVGVTISNLEKARSPTAVGELAMS